MGHRNETGIIPRFCEDLFQRIENSDDESVSKSNELNLLCILLKKVSS